MKKLMFTLCVLAGAGTMFLTACKDDDPAPSPKLSFASRTMEVKESDGEVEIELVLDKAFSRDITVTYTLGGTAKNSVNAGNQIEDYDVVGEYGEVEIEAGETTGVIKLQLYSDDLLEDDETIIIKFDEVDDERIEITRDDDIEITLLQEDGMLVVLDWPAPSANGQADMDIFLRVGSNITTWDGILFASWDISFTGPEFIFIPDVLNFAAYGLSYTYYGYGDPDDPSNKPLDPLNFEVTFAEFKDGQFELATDVDIFEATYTVDNINSYDNPNTTIVVQTFTKTAGVIGNVSEITVPDEGSRIATQSLPLLGKIRERGTPTSVPMVLQKRFPAFSK